MSVGAPFVHPAAEQYRLPMHELVDEEIFDLVYAALDDGVASLSDGTLLPFAMIEGPSGRRLARFVAEPYEEGVRRAGLAVAEQRDAHRVLIAYDGYVTLDGVRSDALVIEAHDRRRTHGVTFALRYRPASSEGGFEVIGDPAFTGPGDPLLPSASGR
jgi:hypothetical protein